MPAHTRRVLCVEDDADTCALLRIILERLDCEVTCASTPAEGLRLARSRAFDLYLLDQWLGADGTGVGLCAQIRQFDAQTPIVFFSGMAHESDRERALAAGAQAYLVKPNDIDAVADTVRRLLNEGVYAYD